MKQRIPLLCCLLIACSTCLKAQGAPAGTVILHATFDTTNALRALKPEDGPAVQIMDGFKGTPSIEITAPKSGSKLVQIPLSIEDLRGARIRVEAMVKAAEVSTPPNPWNGIKCMLHIAGPAGSMWPQKNNVFGTFDWTKIEFTTRVPREATSAMLVLGLEQVSGRAAFDDVRITVLTPPRVPAAKAPAGEIYKGHTLPRLRGVMLGHVKASDLQELGTNWGANHVRWQLIWGGFPHSPADNGDLAAYDKWLAGEIKRLDELLPVCEAAGIKVLIDLHTPPGGRNAASECRLFHEKRFQESFLGWWDKMSKHFRSSKAVWGYDLVNEPVEGTLGQDCMNWQQLATAAARIVRTNDPNHAIVIEPEPWGGPESMENLTHLPVSGIVYSPHMYIPHNFTHQGVYNKKTGLTYPGLIDGTHWDKDKLRKALQPVIDFQRDFNVHIYIGEFSAIRWAPDDSAYRYLRDCIDIFEENGWDWAYHAFREWDGWSVEHGPDKDNHAKSPTETSRARLLKGWFDRNSRP
jgi:endoglucanase